MTYVIFKDDTQTHTEVFFTGHAGGALRYSSESSVARKFKTAREAYETAASYMALQYWKVRRL